MRKGRVIVILCLSLILCFMCLITNTFSWFNRTEESGKTLIYRNKTLKQSSGKSYDVATYKQDDSGEYSEPLNDNTISENAPLTLEPGKRQCFKTQIKSNNNSKQNASLYLSGVKSDDYINTYVGVNNPMRTYKTVGTPESKIKNENGKKNVYVGIHQYSPISSEYQPSRFKLHWWKSDGTEDDANIEFLHSVNYKIYNDNYDVYHAEVPWDARDVRIKQDGKWEGGQIPLANGNYNFVCLLLNNNGNFNNFYGQKVDKETPAGIEYFYTEASIYVNGKIDLTASGNGNLEYKSSNTSIARVEKDSDGKAYVIGVKEGEAEITVTSTGTVCDKADGRMPDTQTFTCKVHVMAEKGKLSEIPVVTNMEISKYNSETDQNIITVYWYIKNAGSKRITVSVDKINVTL